MVSVDRLGKRYGGRWIFRGLTFELGKGDRLLVTGKNGSGKSTLLKTIAGLTDRTEGKISLPEGDPRRTVGLCALDQAVYSTLTPAEHLQLTADLRGCLPRTQELLETVNLAYAANVPSAKLSTGMRARLKLAIAIQPEPKALLLDEPGAGLDEEGRDLLDRIASEQADRGCLIVATNDPAERRFASHELHLAS